MPSGWQWSRYFYRDPQHTRLLLTAWGGGGLVWSESSGEAHDSANQIVRRYTRAFIGTEAEFRQGGTPPP